MSDTRSPLEILDDAVRAYLEQTNTNGYPVGTLAGWVLAVSELQIVDDPDVLPLTTAHALIGSPSTTNETAAGLLRFGTLVVDNALLEGWNR